ncbi:VOC family protein [Tunturiibacter lichenicola]|uniref:VOC family protein n=1 Tax=Acidobacteriaceae TaxID=204434 RepID=UPI001008AB03|nr:VOC family protein [Edaphobacter lichenicola]
MIWNRSIPRATVIPVLAYLNANEAAAWLCQAFAFTVRLRVDTHRVQLNVGEGAIIARELRPHEIGGAVGLGHSVTVRIDDADAHCNHAREHGAKITQEPGTHPYGERQYVAEDLAGHSWTFSQSVSDILPEDWGGISEQLQ